MTIRAARAVSLVLIALHGTAAAKGAQPPDATAAPAPPPSLNFRTGEVALPNGKARLHLGSQYRYLDPAETQKLLTAWGNPPESAKGTQGTVVASGVDVFAPGAWAVILTYLDDGHVDDSDARKIDYREMLKDMQRSTHDANAEREKAGYGSVELVGWANPPRYDDATHKLYWAKQLKFNGEPDGTLNYDVRVLGRDGVLSMNAVGGMQQLGAIQSDMQSLLRVAEFNQGQRYSDFDKGKDRLAAYGLGALVAGGVAAKMGLFAKLLAVVLAAKKVIIATVIAAGAAISRWFKGRSQPSS